jgi:hypothetical protein
MRRWIRFLFDTLSRRRKINNKGKITILLLRNFIPLDTPQIGWNEILKY